MIIESTPCNPHRYVPCYITEEKRFGQRCSQCGVILRGNVKAVPKVNIKYEFVIPEGVKFKTAPSLVGDTERLRVLVSMPKWKGKYKYIVTTKPDDVEYMVAWYAKSYYEARA